MTFRLPIFPLQVVLFPGTPLPLHIFEPRYRQLLADCLSGDERFGIVAAAEDTEDAPPGSIGCVAHVRASQMLADGRSNIVVLGESRFVVRAYLDEDLPYRVATVDVIEDQSPPHHDAEELSVLRHHAERYRHAVGLLNDVDTQDPTWADDPTAFSFQISALLEVPLGVKQQLLALRSVGERIHLLVRLLPGLAEQASERAGVHVGARTNGKGGRQPEIVTGP